MHMPGQDSNNGPKVNKPTPQNICLENDDGFHRLTLSAMIIYIAMLH